MPLATRALQKILHFHIGRGMVHTMEAYSSMRTMWLLSSNAPYCMTAHTHELPFQLSLIAWKYKHVSV